MRLSRLRLVSATAVVPLVFLAGCSGSGSTTATKPSTSPSASAAATPLADVTVSPGTGKTKDVPKVELKNTPVTTGKTVTRVVRPGTGATLTKDYIASISYSMFNGKDGKQLDTSFGQKPVSMDVGSQQVIPGLVKGLDGQKVGSRVLVAIPPVDAFGTKGQSQIGIGANDTIVMLIDVKSAYKKLTTAQGQAVKPKAGLPTVKVDGAKAAQVTIPKTAPPTKLVVQPLIKGAGPTTVAGQTITVNYTGVLWKNGKVFDSSAKQGKPAEFPIGVKRVIPGWDKGLVGQTVGSRVLLVVPPADGYGAKGQPAAGITGKDTLVFVVDILSAS